MTPQVYCRRICQKSGSNFVLTFYLFGRQKRRALEAFYAFCRKVDDSVDLAKNAATANQAIGFWKEEVVRIYQTKPNHPIGQALVPVVEQFAIPQKYLAEIVAGCEMDLNKKIYSSFEELETYCYRVASCVGLVCLRIFGVEPTESATEAAVALGKALQLTNILRDIVTDLRRERVYLPKEDLDRFKVTVEDLAGGGGNNLNLLDLLYFEIDRAKAFYNQAWRLFPTARKERRKLLAAFVMGRCYETILQKIRQNPLQIFNTKVGLSRGEKLRIFINEILNVL